MAEAILKQQSVRKRRPPRRPVARKGRSQRRPGNRVLGAQSVRSSGRASAFASASRTVAEVARRMLSRISFSLSHDGTSSRRILRSRKLGLPRIPEGVLSLIGRVYQPQDTAVLIAAIVVLMLAAGTMTPAGVFYDMATTPSSVGLPMGGGSSVLLDRIRPAEEYQVIGEERNVTPEQFRKLEVQEYTLVDGDTLLGLALENDLRMDTLVSFNQIDDVRRMRVGETYRIPNRDGLLYTVREGDSLQSIAGAHGSEVNAILDANDLMTSEIAVGEVLFVPEARMNETELKLILGELFVYPVRGRFTSGFGMRNDPFTGVRRFHNGIDLAGAIGTPIRAAMAGRVVHIETQIGNYGRFVILRHDGGYQSLYGHLEDLTVRVGQYVSQGGQLGTMGNTGRSTGPHLHFSIIKNGAFVDPLDFLH